MKDTKNYDLIRGIEESMEDMMNSDVFYDVTGLFVVQELHAVMYGHTREGYDAYKGVTEEDVISALRSAGKKLEYKLEDEDRVAIAEYIEDNYEKKLSNRSTLMLSDFVLYNYLEGDTDTYKMQNTEYPILSDTQRDRRIGKRGVRGNYEVSSVWLENVASSSV